MSRIFLSRPRRILFVGEAATISRDLLAHLIELAPLQFEIAETGATGVTVAASPARQFDAIMVNHDLPDTDGSVVCAKMRERGIQIPILLLAGRATEMQVIRGLDSGANDFIVAPIRHGEVAARLRAQIRAYETSEEAVLNIGPFQFRPSSRVLQHSQTNERQKLTEKEAAVLKFLYRADGPVPRNTLLHEVWGYNARATTHTVETHIYRLRRKIEPDPTQIALLVNENGGYRLCAGSVAPASMQVVGMMEEAGHPQMSQADWARRPTNAMASAPAN